MRIIHIGTFQVQQMIHKDTRVKLINEVLNGIKVCGNKSTCIRIVNKVHVFIS